MFTLIDHISYFSFVIVLKTQIKAVFEHPECLLHMPDDVRIENWHVWTLDERCDKISLMGNRTEKWERPKPICDIASVLEILFLEWICIELKVPWLNPIDRAYIMLSLSLITHLRLWITCPISLSA